MASDPESRVIKLPVALPDGAGTADEHRHTEDPVPFRCDVIVADDRATVVARGEVDFATSAILLRKVSATLALPVTTITVDLGYVTFLDSTGVSALVGLLKGAGERGIGFRLEAVPRQARLVLEQCDLLNLFGLPARSDASVPPTVQGGAAA